MTSIETLVQRQLDAYNQHDINAFLACFSDDVRMYELGENSPFIEGLTAARETYEPLFTNSPDLHVELVNRIANGDIVVDHEHVIGMGDDGPMRCIAIYRIKENQIASVWFG